MSNFLAKISNVDKFDPNKFSYLQDITVKSFFNRADACESPLTESTCTVSSQMTNHTLRHDFKMHFQRVGSFCKSNAIKPIENMVLSILKPDSPSVVVAVQMTEKTGHLVYYSLSHPSTHFEIDNQIAEVYVAFILVEANQTANTYLGPSVVYTQI